MNGQEARDMVKWAVKWFLYWATLLGLLIMAGVILLQAVEANAR